MAVKTSFLAPWANSHHTERTSTMRKRITALLIAALAVAGIGGTASMATAKNGADDPAGHVRGADDGPNHR